MARNRREIITTGLSGLIGSRISKLLAAKYYFYDLSLPQYNILDFKKIEKVFKEQTRAKIVFHLAAFTDVTAAWKQRGNKNGLCYQINVVGTRNLVKLCRRYQKFLVFVSTDYVFDGRKELSYLEEDRPNPIEWYGQTKLLAEKEIQERLQDFVITRVAFPYRAYFTKKTDYVRKIIQGLEEKNLYPMFTDQIITLTFIDDLAFGFDQIFKKKPRGIFHLVGSDRLSPYQIARQVAEIFGFSESLLKKGSLAQYQKCQVSDDRPWHKYLALSNQKARKELGTKMSTLKEGLQEMKRQLSAKFTL